VVGIRRECRICSRCGSHSQIADVAERVVPGDFSAERRGIVDVEKTIDGEISLEDVIVTYRALVHSGAPIVEINAIRKHLSAVKGDGWHRRRIRRSKFHC